jgi:hypothetical protein
MGSWDEYAYDNIWYKFINIRENASEVEEVRTDMAYTLIDAQTFNYAVYDPLNNHVRMVASVNVDENNPNHCWQTLEVNGRKILYNIGAKKFAVPATDGQGFMLSDEVGSITMKDGKDGIILGGYTETQWAFVRNDRMNDGMVKTVLVK